MRFRRMLFDTKHTDALIQYALLLAGEEDELFERQLGPIHLVKYVYLSDLLHARRFDGTVLTGADWRFHKFGPWSLAVYERIEPAVQAIHAEAIKIESRYGDEDWVRYRLRDTAMLKEVERAVPSAIKLQLPRDIHTFLADTPALLDYVYKTEPMLHAAPGERLDFSRVAPARVEKTDEPTLRLQQLSSKKEKQFRERVASIREKRPSRAKLINPVTAPRYDEVYQAGIEWLDELGGSNALEPGTLTAEFSEAVWKSAARKGGDVP